MLAPADEEQFARDLTMTLMSSTYSKHEHTQKKNPTRIK